MRELLRCRVTILTGKYFTPESMSKADQNPELTKDAKAAVGEALGNLELLM